MRARVLVPVFLALALPAPAFALTAGKPDVAALQVGLRSKHLYGGTIDGLPGPGTLAAVRALRHRSGGLEVRAALGAWGEPSLGSRTLAQGMTGWDVAELQYLLAWHGFPSGQFDGAFGPELEGALLRFQAWAGLPPAGVAGPLTRAALRSPPPRSPIRLDWPLRGSLGDLFGPRGDRFHAGIDIAAPLGVPVWAARTGRVVFAGSRAGWGNEVTIAVGHGVRTLYAHLSQIDVHVGQRVATGAEIGLVGATGDATGPHLHFEVRVRGAAVDPLSALAG